MLDETHVWKLVMSPVPLGSPSSDMACVLVGLESSGVCGTVRDVLQREGQTQTLLVANWRS
jgi:hypothetical protein